jgi:hypothetical protein
MTTEVKIILASKNGATHDTVVSMLCTYPRRIHSELMTHRVFSRNAKSSRAIPVKKYIDEATYNPARKLCWRKAQKGMQGGEYIEGDDRLALEDSWNRARSHAVYEAETQLRIGASKQDINRILEPFIHMTILITATEWKNFFFRRSSDAADPEIALLSDTMLHAYLTMKPQTLYPGEWHLPWIDKHVQEGASLPQKIKISTARSARLSYMTFDNEIDPEKDYLLHDSLLHDVHMSPLEHPCEATIDNNFHGNLKGFRSYRLHIPEQSGEHGDLHELAKQRGILL